MFDAAIKALIQMFSPPFRRVLLKSIGLALVLIVLIGIGLNRLFSWLATTGATWAEAIAGGHTAWQVLAWVLSIVADARHHHRRAVPDAGGDRVRRQLLRRRDRRRGRAQALSGRSAGPALPLCRALIEGIKTALLALLVYLCAVPFLFFAGLGLLIMFFANAYLLSREYFLLAAMRFHPAAEAKALRRAHRSAVFFAGLFIAVFVSIPIVNLATPLFAMALMVHMHKRLSAAAASS